jgi:hypothetical protein
MEPRPVIEHPDKLKDRSRGLFAGSEVLIMDQLILERLEESLDHGVVIAIAFVTDAGDQSGLPQLPLVRPARVRRPLVRVMDQPRLRASMCERHLQRRQRHLLIRLRTHGPADHTARVQVQDHGQLDPARSCGNRREIARPDAIGCGSNKDLLELVQRWGSEPMLFEYDPELSCPTRFEPMDPSQPCHAMTPTAHACSPQDSPQLHGSIPLLGLPMEQRHPFEQAGVRLRPGTRRSMPPRIVSTATDSDHLTEPREAMLGLKGLDEPILHGDSRAKKGAVGSSDQGNLKGSDPLLSKISS